MGTVFVNIRVTARLLGTPHRLDAVMSDFSFPMSDALPFDGNRDAAHEWVDRMVEDLTARVRAEAAA